MSDSDVWIDVKTAADILRVSERQVNRRGNDGDIQTKRVGPRRVLYLRTDVERLATDLQVMERPRQQVIPKREMIPMREVVASIERAQQELTRAREEVGYLRGQLDTQQKQLVDAKATEQRLVDAQARIAELETRLNQKEQDQRSASWWRKLLK